MFPEDVPLLHKVLDLCQNVRIGRGRGQLVRAEQVEREAGVGLDLSVSTAKHEVELTCQLLALGRTAVPTSVEQVREQLV